MHTTVHYFITIFKNLLRKCKSTCKQSKINSFFVKCRSMQYIGLERKSYLIENNIYLTNKDNMQIEKYMENITIENA